MEFELKTVPEQKIAYTQHKGSYEDLRNSIATVTLWALNKGLKITDRPVNQVFKKPKVNLGGFLIPSP